METRLFNTQLHFPRISSAILPTEWTLIAEPIWRCKCSIQFLKRFFGLLCFFYLLPYPQRNRSKLITKQFTTFRFLCCDVAILVQVFSCSRMRCRGLLDVTVNGIRLLSKLCWSWDLISRMSDKEMVSTPLWIVTLSLLHEHPLNKGIGFKFLTQLYIYYFWQMKTYRTIVGMPLYGLLKFLTSLLLCRPIMSRINIHS